MVDHSTEKQPIGSPNRMLRLFLISVLGLFLELLLIRWITTEINIFAYLQNTVLVVCFMGLGMGCLSSRQPASMYKGLIALFFLVLLLSITPIRLNLGKTSALLSALGDLEVWQMAVTDSPLGTVMHVSIGLMISFFLMVLMWGVFFPIGRTLGRLMDEDPSPIRAYSINIAGSLIGIWLFTLLSVFYQPPGIWFLIVAALTLPFIGNPGRERYQNVILVCAIVVLSWFAGSGMSAIEVLWSPYQKLALHSAGNTFPPGNFYLNVNNTFYLGMFDLRDENIRLKPEIYPAQMRGFSQYDIPPLLHSRPETALVVGSGGGNDVAGALRHGVKRVTAVEIDPAIIQLGRKYHAEKPYNSPKVEIINDDARSFFATSQGQYDLIVFGLLDSHTTTAMTNARLDHYVYTEEALQKAKSLMAPGGIMTLAFEATKPYIADRIARVLRDVFGREPIAFKIPLTGYGPGGLMFVAGNSEMARQRITENAPLRSLIAGWQKMFPSQFTYSTPVTTDDWPYLYLHNRQIPLLYGLLALLMPGLFFYTKWRANLGPLVRGWKMVHWHFFFLGAGFLLLEVQNISKAAVVLGNTWWVNAVVISGILAMILLANWISLRFAVIPLSLVYVGLIGSCAILYFVDLSQFAFLPYFEKALVVGFLAGLPVMFSGVIFARSFSAVSRKDSALGSNLFGAMIGGLLQSLTFITGIKALLLVAAGLYGMAMLTGPKAPDGKSL